MDKTVLIHSVFNSMNSRDFSGLEENVTEGVIFDFPGAGQVVGHKRVILFLNALLRRFKVLHFTVSGVIIDGDKACAVWTNKGQYGSGEDYANSGVTLFYFSSNKISFLSDYFKDTSFVEKK